MSNLKTIISGQLPGKLQQLEYEAQERLRNMGVLYWQNELEYINSEIDKVNKLKIKYTNIVNEIHEKVKNHPEFIPQNTIYCYTGFNSTYKCCPYWAKTPFEGIQNDGLCLYLNEYDSEVGLGLLWDQCKSCTVSLGEYE